MPQMSVVYTHGMNGQFSWLICDSTHLLPTAFYPSGVGKWVPASAGKAKAGIVHSINGWKRGVQARSLENVCHIWASEVCSRRGAIQINVSLCIHSILLPPQIMSIIEAFKKRLNVDFLEKLWDWQRGFSQVRTLLNAYLTESTKQKLYSQP